MNESKFKNKKLLIVGGTGFIGSFAARHGVKNGYEVSVLSRNDLKKSEKIKNVEYLLTDLIEYNNLSGILKNKNFSHVINLSGEINHSDFASGGDLVIKNHFVGLLNLVSCLNRASLKSFVQVGSSDEYGSSNAPQNENQTCIPLTNYSFAKLTGNNFLRMLNATENFPAIMIRLFLVYGTNQNSSRLLPQIISSCLLNETFSVSKGEQIRDFCFVEDVIQGIFLALESDGLFGNIFNIASGDPVSIKNTVNKVVSMTGKGSPVFGDLPYRKNENMKLFADVTKANNLLNWKPTIGLEEGLKKTIKYYKSNLSL